MHHFTQDELNPSAATLLFVKQFARMCNTKKTLFVKQFARMCNTKKTPTVNGYHSFSVVACC